MIWDVDPVMIDLGFHSLRYYTFMLLCCYFAAKFIMKTIYRLEGKDPGTIEDAMMLVVFSIIIFSRLVHCLFYDPAYYLSNPLEILKVWKGGLASHGNAIGLLVGVYIYVSRTKDITYFWLIDRVSIPAALACSFIRIGNLFNSEIVGKPTDVPWAFTFTRLDQVPRHPTQLYEALCYMVIFVVLVVLYRKKVHHRGEGLFFGAFVSSALFCRLLLEFTKETQTKIQYDFPLNMGQMLSLPFIAGGIWLVWRALRKPNNSVNK